MFFPKGVLIVVLLATFIAYKVNNVYVIENFEDPYSFKFAYVIAGVISTIVSIMIFIFVC